MTRNFLFALMLILAAAGSAVATSPAPLQLSTTDRLLVFAPHPDDEILGTGGVIQRAVRLKIPVHVMFLTYGDNNAWSFTVYRKHPIFTPEAMRRMGEVRRKEAVAASKILGLQESDLTFLGYPDHGMMRLWIRTWNDAPAFVSEMTHVSKVPYKNAYHYLADYKGEEVLSDIRAVLRDVRPTKIFVTSSADENPDHRAAYLFLRVALMDLAEEMSPQVFPFLVHYRFRHWPTPQGYHPTLTLEVPAIFTTAMAWNDFDLTKEEVAGKYVAIQQHKTQFEYSGKYLSSFVRVNEMFGDFPLYRLQTSTPTDIEASELVAESELPEDFTDEEKASFVNFDTRKAVIKDGEIVLSTHFKNPLREKVRLSICLFGYKKDKPFGTMPKIRIEVGRFVHKYFDGGKRLPKNAMGYSMKERQVTIRVPMDLLGDPDVVLTGVQARLEEFPLNTMAWRTLIVARKPKNAGPPN